MKIVIGSDHAGYELKTKILTYLNTLNVEVSDLGTNSLTSCDYNDFAVEVATAVSQGKADRGILICGTGIGMSIQANKVSGVRAALVHDLFSAKATRLHNNSNVLTMGGRIIGEDLAKEIVHVWLHTEFSNEERHQRRVNKLEK